MTTRDEALRAFVHDDYAPVLRTLTAACGDRGRAEDALQDALAKTWERDADPDSFAAWITVVAMNVLRSGARRRSAEARALERWSRLRAAPAAVADSTGGDLLAGLPRLQREVAALHYLGDLSVVDVARALGVSEGTVKTSLHRARHALRAVLAHEQERTP